MDDFIEYDGAQDMKKLFETILGSKVDVRDDINNAEEKLFTIFINKLEKQNKVENKVFDSSGLELTKITDNLWFVVETLLKTLYGKEATNVIMWYILFKDDTSPSNSGGGGYWEEDGKSYKINTVKRLWRFIKDKLITE